MEPDGGFILESYMDGWVDCPVQVPCLPPPPLTPRAVFADSQKPMNTAEDLVDRASEEREEGEGPNQIFNFSGK